MYRWVAERGFYPNIPARDLTAADIEAIDPALLEMAIGLGCYIEVAR